ncbi:MAG: hypothetical protein EA378_06355 [Phycisphaerales bacterium]|nr:MAG: hypothetical protein EA378_06355 [Phycisphaerales bacterium]
MPNEAHGRPRRPSSGSTHASTLPQHTPRPRSARGGHRTNPSASTPHASPRKRLAIRAGRPKSPTTARAAPYPPPRTRSTRPDFSTGSPPGRMHSNGVSRACVVGRGVRLIVGSAGRGWVGCGIVRPSVRRVLFNPLVVLAVSGAVCGLGAPALGQPGAPPVRQAVDEALGVYDGRPIRELRLRRVPTAAAVRAGDTGELSAESTRFARNQIRSREGEPFNAEIASGDLRQLNRTGRYRRVESSVQLLADGGVVLEFVLIEQPIVLAVDIVGNKRIGTGRLRQVVDVLVGTPVDEIALNRSARSIESVYRERNYYRVEVDIDQQELEETGVVIFRVQEGVRLRITDIRFEGAESFRARQLRTAISSREAWLLDRGRIDEDRLIEDVASIREFYQDRGYLDARVGRIVRESPNGREAIVTFVIDEGPLYTLRDVRLEYTDADMPGVGEPPDAHDPDARPVGVFTPEQVRGLLPIQRGDAYGLRDVRTSVNSLRTALGKLGYTQVRVERVEFRDPDRPEVDILLRVTQGRRFITGEIIIQGNELTKDRVIRRVSPIRPERPLDLDGVEEYRRRLRELNLFDMGESPPRVTVQPNPNPLDPPDTIRRDALVEVKETNTGRFNIGGTFSSDAGVVGNVQLLQRNFDITDFPDSPGEFFTGRAFRGAGQTFDLTIAPGTQVETYRISLTEPYLFDTDYSATWLAQYRKRRFREYDEERFGGSLGFGRRFGTRWVGSLAVRGESVQLFNISEDSPAEFFDAEDRRFLTSLGLSLTRNTLDSNYRPTRGTRVRLAAEQIGVFGGDFDFTKLEAESVFYLTLYEDFRGRNTIMNVRTNASYIPQGDSRAPVYERYYLGGRTFRGFDFRTVSPKGVTRDGRQTDEPVGGSWLFFLGGEIQQPLLGEFFSIVGFVDSGTVTSEVGFDDYRVSVGVGARFYIPQLSPVPLAFDFGFPIVKQEGDQRRMFSFSLDLPF